MTVALAVGATWAAFTRSAIPVALEGRVLDVTILHEKHPGRDDVYLIELPDRTVHVDAAVGQGIARGDELAKPAWSATLTTSSGIVRLKPSRDVWGLAAAGALVILTCWLLTRPRSSGTR